MSDESPPPADTAKPDKPAPRSRKAPPPPVVTFQAPPPAPEPPPTPEAPAATPAAHAPAGGALAPGSPAPGAGTGTPTRSRSRSKPAGGRAAPAAATPAGAPAATPAGAPAAPAAPADGSAAAPADDAPGDGEGGTRRRRRRSRAKTGDEGGQPDADAAPAAAETADGPTDGEEAAEADGGTGRRRRRRRRRRGGEDDDETEEAPSGRAAREDGDEVRGVSGSTRLEAKRQRRREGRESGRRRVAVITEAEFLARRESVERVMVVRQGADRTQIGVLEDGVLVEHYIERSNRTSGVGNVYLGRVQNVLPGMEAAFVDIGRGRNAVLYAGEVNYDASAIEGRPSRIEQALKSGQPVLVQVTKDPIGHKGARLTSQISIPGRFLVFVPEGRMTGISRKLPDRERTRLKTILRQICPEGAGVIVRTAAEGASEEELTRDMARLRAQWEAISKKATQVSAPALVYAEPDLVIRVIRDIFNEDFSRVVVQGDTEWDTVEAYVGHVAPDLADRVSKWAGQGDVFAEHRVDEQLAKALDRKVWLPSGGYLVVDRTEAMIVIDVNTGKFIGKGGNLEATVTKNNLEAAEEIVRQLRLRDLGGIIVIDFIDMVLESNRDLVLRRLLECLGRDRTKHQVAEVTSLGLVQMTRKRIGQGLLEAFSEPCPECGGRGVKITIDPFQPPVEERGRRGRGRTPVPPGRGGPAAVAAAPDGGPVAPDGGPVAPDGGPVATEVEPVAPDVESVAPPGDSVSPDGAAPGAAAEETDDTDQVATAEAGEEAAEEAVGPPTAPRVPR